MNTKKLLNILLYLLPWFLSSIIFKIDTNYYKELNLPFFAPPSYIFAIIWPILYLLIAYVLYKTIQSSNDKYKKVLIVNYISNQLYTFFFFTIKSNPLAFIDTIIVLISSILLYKEVNKIDAKYSKYLIPYILWNSFATILSFGIILMN